MLESGVQLYEPVLAMLLAIGTPASRLLLEPLLSRIVTVPSVVGFQLMVDCWPAVKESPEEGMLKGLAFDDWAIARDARAAR